MPGAGSSRRSRGCGAVSRNACVGRHPGGCCMKWLKALWRRLRGYRSERVSELSNRLRSRRVYLLGEGAVPWCAAMLCPCGCREILHLSLLPDDRPRWACTEHDDGTVSLHPSVCRVRGCRSHFVLQRGEILWCRSGAVVKKWPDPAVRGPRWWPRAVAARTVPPPTQPFAGYGDGHER